MEEKIKSPREYFDKSVNQNSPVETDYVRKVKHCEKKGETYEEIVFEPFDYVEYQKSLGPVQNWSLEALLKAGINPNFSISTGYNTRLEGVNEIDSILSTIDSLKENNNENKN